MKKILCVFLCVLLVSAIIPMQVHANNDIKKITPQSGDVYVSGTKVSSNKITFWETDSFGNMTESTEDDYNVKYDPNPSDSAVPSVTLRGAVIRKAIEFDGYCVSLYAEDRIAIVVDGFNVIDTVEYTGVSCGIKAFSAYLYGAADDGSEATNGIAITRKSAEESYGVYVYSDFYLYETNLSVYSNGEYTESNGVYSQEGHVVFENSEIDIDAGKATGTNYASCYGVYARSINVIGCNVYINSGDAEATASDSYSLSTALCLGYVPYGYQATENPIVNSNVICRSGRADYSAGIMLTNYVNLNLKSSRLIASAAEATGESYGLYEYNIKNTVTVDKTSALELCGLTEALGGSNYSEIVPGFNGDPSSVYLSDSPYGDGRVDLNTYISDYMFTIRYFLMPQIITNVDIMGCSLPVIGYTASEACEAHTVQVPYYTGGATWYSDKLGRMMNADDVFSEGDTYRMSLKIYPDEAYIISSNAKSTLTANDGTKIEVDTVNSFFHPDSGTYVIMSKPIKAIEEKTACPSSKFTDVVPFPHWAHKGIDYALNHGLFAGVSDTSFAPNRAMTRAMLVTVLYSMAGKPDVKASDKFSDVPVNSYYAKAVTWAETNDIVAGTGDGIFSPNNNVTREQLALILFKYSENYGFDTSSMADISGYPDAYMASNWAKTALGWAISEGLISGVANGNDVLLSPKGNATRAQVALILMNYIENYTPWGL